MRGGDWSLAWRVFDAQFWGVPQRRRRIALVADFGGLTAPEILFERKGVSGYYPQGRTPWETATRPVEDCFRETGSRGGLSQPTYCIQGNCIDRADTAGCNGKGWTEDVSYTLNTVDRPAVAPMNVPLADVASTLRAGAGMPKHEADVKGRLVVSIENHPNDSRVKFSEDNVVQALTGRMGTGGGGNTPMILNMKQKAD